LLSAAAYAGPWEVIYELSDSAKGMDDLVTDFGYAVLLYDGDGYENSLVAVDTLGSELWRTTVSNGEYLIAQRLCLLPDGCIAVLLISVRPSESDHVAVAKVGQTGELLWRRGFGHGWYGAPGDIASGPQGGTLLADNLILNRPPGVPVIAFRSLLPGCVPFNKPVLVKIDAEGGTEWQLPLGGNMDDLVDCIVPAAEGGWALLGKTERRSGERDNWLAGISLHGEVVWSRAFGSEDGWKLFSIVPMPDVGYILLGSTGESVDSPSTGLLVAVDSEGEVTFSRTYETSEGSGYVNSVLPGPEDGYLLLGSVSSQGTDPHRRFEQWNRLWIVETDSLFREVGQRVFALPGRLATQIGASDDGSYWVVCRRGNEGQIRWRIEELQDLYDGLTYPDSLGPSELPRDYVMEQ
jgi:hypothetical protein